MAFNFDDGSGPSDVRELAELSMFWPANDGEEPKAVDAEGLDQTIECSIVRGRGTGVCQDEGSELISGTANWMSVKRSVHFQFL